MTGSPVFSINLTYLGIPANPNYHMSIKKSQAILKCFIDLMHRSVNVKPYGEAGGRPR